MVKIKKLSTFSFLALLALFSPSIFADQPRLSSDQIVLYYHPGCGHCQKVLSYLSSVRKTIPMKSTTNPRYQNELLSMGQKGVPVLVVNSRIISGDTQIINYLKEHPQLLNP